MAKIGLQLKGFEDLMEDLNKLGGDLNAVTTEALEKSHAMVTPEIIKAMGKHNRSHATEKSIDRSGKVYWKGDVAEVGIGFDISNGGLPSVFLMYGTPKHAPNHPGTSADKKLYGAIYGSTMRKKLSDLQEEIILGAINKRL